MTGQRRAKRFLSPQQKYEIWVRILRGETTVGAAADEAGVDRSTVMKLREVARQGALAALAQSRPGVRKVERDHELEAAKAEIVRLGDALKRDSRFTFHFTPSSSNDDPADATRSSRVRRSSSGGSPRSSSGSGTP